MFSLVSHRPSHDSGRQAIVPFLSQGAELSVELPHGYALRVKYFVFDELLKFERATIRCVC